MVPVYVIFIVLSKEIPDQNNFTNKIHVCFWYGLIGILNFKVIDNDIINKINQLSLIDISLRGVKLTR